MKCLESSNTCLVFSIVNLISNQDMDTEIAHIIISESPS